MLESPGVIDIGKVVAGKQRPGFGNVAEGDGVSGHVVPNGLEFVNRVGSQSGGASEARARGHASEEIGPRRRGFWLSAEADFGDGRQGGPRDLGGAIAEWNRGRSGGVIWHQSAEH